MDLQTIWFILIGVLFAGYAILDGFDLGVGILQLFCRRETERSALLQSIAPFWDGNEVWLLTGGGALFAAFPHAYATVFSGFYLAIMLLLVGLIFRAVSIEYRNQVASAGWRAFWDKAFSLSSALVALLLGVALGNVIVGIPLDSGMNYTGSFFTLLRPVPLLTGIAGLFAIILQGAAYLQLKTTGELRKKANGWAKLSLKALVAALFLLTLGIALLHRERFFLFLDRELSYAAMVIALAVIWGIHGSLAKNAHSTAFVLSSCNLLSLFLITALFLFPNIVNGSDPAASLTIYNASSSPLTLRTMLIIACIGMPVVLGYTIYVYRLFRTNRAGGM